MTSDTEYLDKNLATAIFRIFQEALTNVIRHAEATEVTVSLWVEQQFILLQLKDNGKGIEDKHIFGSQSFGLIGMRERALSWGGEVQITPGEEGTMVQAKLPFRENDQKEKT